MTRARGQLAMASVVSGLASGLICGGLVSCKPSPRTLTVGAAISLKEPMTAIAADYEKAHGKHLELVFGASGELASQMRRGAPFDLLCTAGDEPALASSADVRCTVARNTLVLVRRKGESGAPATWDSLAATAPSFRLAIGLTPQVPAGVYAEQALRSLGAWDAVHDKLVRGTNVRHVLDLVARGEADAGIVYATDVSVRSDVESLGAVPERASPKVAYPLYLARDASSESRALADYLCGPDAARVLSAHGFLPP